jgi:ABC-type uncharacterized transport system substrate-binding protein
VDQFGATIIVIIMTTSLLHLEHPHTFTFLQGKGVWQYGKALDGLHLGEVRVDRLNVRI